MVDDNIYYVEIVDSIRENQKIGDTPNYCIPLTINAITVQGISYSDPYFSSFKLNYKMALGAPEYMNKSDYTFKSSVYIKRVVEVDTMRQPPLNEKSVIKHCEMNSPTHNITSEDDSERIDHDNNVLRSESDKMVRSFTNGDLTFDALLELIGEEGKVIRAMCETQGCDAWGTPCGLRLCGGGETSLNSAAGWGSPPAPSSNAGNWSGSGPQSNPPNNTQAQWNNANQRPPTSQSDNAGNSTNVNNGGNSPNSPANAPGGNGATNNANNTSSAKIEQLSSMREALFSQEGWGGQHVNQDTNWDVPGSPEPGSKVEPTAGGGPPAWKPNINNGTDLWEANLRNGGQPPAQPASKTPWGHTPTTNIGGTWGEDDDAGDSANVWSGPPPQQWPAGPPQQQHWSVPKKDDWNTWGEPHRSSDPRLDSHRSQDPRAPPDPRHDPRSEMRGISGRLNGEMWGQHVQQHANKMIPGGINQWNSQGPKDSIKGTGWEEPSPPAARRSASGFDDGTSLWAQRGGVGMPGRGGPQGPPSQQRMPPTPTKPDAVWGSHPPRNGSWEEPHTPSWADRDVGGWPDAGGPGLWPSKHKPSGPGGAWPDDIGEWGGPKHPPGGPLSKQLPKDVVWNSKQFRYLVDMGYKKEDVDSALRRCDMNADDAVELLTAAARGDWRGNDHFHHAGFPPSGAPAVSPAVVQKLLGQPPQAPLHPSYGNGGPPSAAQLRMLVQQIQMAVTTGYLNHQILNQPLAPQTLVLLNQLLQQIKALQQLVQQHTLAASKGNTNLAVQCSVQISKAKQQISALQSQISTQQALYMKQQAGTDLFKPNHDPISQLQNNFADMSMNKDPQSGFAGSSNQQSRLNQWKLPSLDKDGESPEFSRAPGTAKSTTSPQLGQIGLQPDTTWGVDRSAAGQGWGDGSDVADGKDAWPSHQPVYDLVPEFEPGKPWKGNQMKSAEDDPAMTPGSVVRSPLSLVSIKDSDILGGKTSPPSGSERSLSSSTWSYAPPSSTTAALKPPADAWGGGKARGTAPQALNKPWPQHHNTNNRQVPTWQASTWLLLKNLTAQIDGSTLKTLCVQHGPLQNFHLYLNQGIALARYSTREEAAKAQMALNNCVLSNTTIFAESPAESDVQMILQHLGSGGGGGWRGKEPAWTGFPSLWATEPEQRSTPSLTNYLPPDLLGGESI